MSPSRRFAAACALAAVVVAVSGCTRTPPDPSRTPIATVAGGEVLLGDFEAYLRSSFPDAASVEAPTVEEGDRVRSRLLDDFLDERLLLAEAEFRGITATDDEVKVYVEGADGAPDDPGRPTAEQREAARREIVIQKLRESAVRAEVHVSDDEAREYLSAHGEVLGDSIDLARRELSLKRSHEATAKLLAELKARAHVKIRTDALPFRYVPAATEAPR